MALSLALFTLVAREGVPLFTSQARSSQTSNRTRVFVRYFDKIRKIRFYSNSLIIFRLYTSFNAYIQPKMQKGFSWPLNLMNLSWIVHLIAHIILLSPPSRPFRLCWTAWTVDLCYLYICNKSNNNDIN